MTFHVPLSRCTLHACVDLRERWTILHCGCYIFGDFSLHLNKRTAVDITLDDILSSFDLKHHVTFYTHTFGHWIDLVIIHSTCDNIQMLTVSDALSNHHTVVVDVSFFQNTNTIKTQRDLCIK